MSCMILQKAFSTVASRALRPIPSPRIISAAVNKMDINNKSHHFCTDANKIKSLDQKLVTVLKSEIKPRDRLAVKKAMPPVPADFPFTIKDVHDYNCINLKRELNGEKIDVDVDLPRGLNIYSSIIGDESDGGSDVSSSGEENSSDNEKEESTADIPAPTVHLKVKISKENGKGLSLHASATSEDIRVTHVTVVEPNPHDSECPHRFGPYALEDGSDLQSDLGEFVEKRCAEKKYVEFLYNYLIRNYDRRYVMMVENMEKFFEE